MMSTVDIDNGCNGSADNQAEIEENIDLPDDFFDEFEDSKFLDEIADIVGPEQAPLIRTTDETTGTNGGTESGRASPEVKAEKRDDNDDATEPMLKRCLEGIDHLSKSIERRKQRLRNEILDNGYGKRKRESHSPSLSSRGDRNARSSRDRRLTPRRSPGGPRSGRRSGRSRSRERNRSRDQRRRNRSRSESPPIPSRSMTFLEELERKFAEKGQDFPEKDLLIQMRSQGNGEAPMNHHPAAMGYSQPPAMCMPPYMQMAGASMQMPMYTQPYHPSAYWNGNYMVDHMPSSMLQHQHSIHQILPPLPCPNDTPSNNVIHSATKISDRRLPSNKDEVVARCRAASKILRGEENKVPKLRFLFTPTSVPLEPSEEETPPMQSKKNVEFEQTADNRKPFAPLHFLPPRTRELVKILGSDCTSILNRLRLKGFADKVINGIEDMDKQEKRTRERSFKESETQTDSYKCPACVTRESKTFSNKAVGTETPKKVSIRVQTNERDYRDPLIRSLSRMTAGQLVAVSDFINLISQPRPSTSTEVFSVREKLMDIYNLSDRGPEAIEAERSRDNEAWRRGSGNNNSAMPSPPMEDLRATIRGTSDNHMGRIPPPPPLLQTYHMDGGMIDPEQEAREMRLQQMRYEENLRLQMQLEEQRNRELEWERQQQTLEWERQQQIIVQQRLLQLQREQEEENARLEMRNDRFGRGGNQWNGGRGQGRY